MGTISDKLEYLNDTKGLLKQKINNLGGSIDDNTTFRQYANQLQNVYDNLPKTSYQEGTEVNLGKTIKGKLDFENGVVGIGQSSQDSTNGFQLLNITATSGTKNGATWVVNEDKSITISTNGVTTGLVTIPVVTSKTLEAGTYYASGVTGGNENTYYFGILSANWVFRNFNGITQFSVSEQKTYTQIWVVIVAGTNLSTPITVYPMISTTNTSDYEPYTNGASPNPSYPQTINSVTGNQDVVVSGKNLLDESTLLQGAWNGTTTKRVYFYANNYLNAGTYTIMTDLNTTDFRYAVNIASNQFPLGSGMSINVYDSSWITTSYKTFTLSQGGYLGVGVKRANEGDIVPSDISSYNFMLYEGEYDSSISYEPYITPTSYQLSLGDKKLYDECTIVGSPDNWKFVDKWGKVNANDFSFGMGDITISGQTYKQFSTPYNTPTILKGGLNTSDKVKCNKFLAGNNVIDTFYINSGKRIVVVAPILNGNYVTDLDTFNTIKSDMYIVGELNTPIETPITDETLINQLNAWYNAHSNNGTTIITSNGNLPMIIKVRALKGE